MAIAFFSAIPAARLHAAGFIFPLVLKWSATFDVPPAFAPAYDGTRGFVALRNDQVMSVSLETGKSLWSVTAPTTAPPAAGDALVFTGGDGFVQALAQADGTNRWRTAVEGAITSIYWDTGWLMVTTNKNALLAMRAVDGTLVWRRDIEAGLQSPPAPDGDRLYLAMKSGALLALAIQTGEPIWTHQLPKPGNGILPVGDRIYIGSQNDMFYCLSARDGNVMWRWKTGADVIGMPAIDAKRVYFVSLDNVLRALDRNSGSVRWQQSLPTRPTTGPLLTGWTILVTGLADLHGYSSEFNGALLGDLPLKTADNQETQLAAPPHITADGTLVLLTRGGQMQALIGSPAPYGP